MKRKKRTPSTRETLLGVVILTLLVGIAAGIFRQQSLLNPAISALKTEFSPPAAPPAAPPLVGPLEDLTPLSPVETFTAETLYEKINGKADLYLSAGFKALSSQRFTSGPAPDGWLEMFRYDMGESRNAFAVYTSQRREDAAAADIGDQSYRTSNALFFTHGPYYVEIVAAAASPAMDRQLNALAQAFVRATPVESAAIAEKDLFPRAHLEADSIALIPSDAFGYDKLNQVFTAAYQLDGRRLTAFISRRGSPTEARELARSFYEFLITFGGEGLTSDPEKRGVVKIFDTYELIFSAGPYLAGVHEAADLKVGERLADMLSQKLAEVSGERSR